MPGMTNDEPATPSGNASQSREKITDHEDTNNSCTEYHGRSPDWRNLGVGSGFRRSLRVLQHQTTLVVPLIAHLIDPIWPLGLYQYVWGILDKLLQICPIRPIPVRDRVRYSRKWLCTRILLLTFNNFWWVELQLWAGTLVLLSPCLVLGARSLRAGFHCRSKRVNHKLILGVWPNSGSG